MTDRPAKRLYRVTIDAVVWAIGSDCKEAAAVAMAGLDEDLDSAGLYFEASEYSGGLPDSDWIDSIPFGSDDDKTVRDWIDHPPGEEPGR